MLTNLDASLMPLENQAVSSLASEVGLHTVHVSFNPEG